MMSCSDSKTEQNGREAAVLADRLEPVGAPGQHLVRVGLVADVPEDLVARRVEQRVQDRGELAGAEVGAEVTADLADRVDDQLADLLGDLGELLVGEVAEVLGPEIASSRRGAASVSGVGSRLMASRRIVAGRANQGPGAGPGSAVAAGESGDQVGLLGVRETPPECSSLY